MDTTVFFNADDGMTVTGAIDTLSISTEGYFDQDLTEFNLDNSGPSQERYLFVCQTFSTWRTAVGETLTISSTDYTITNASADGTGLLTLSLYSE